MKLIYLLLFAIAVLASFGEVDKPFRSGVVVKNIDWTGNPSTLNEMFPFSNTEGWLVFSSKTEVMTLPSDLDVIKMISAYLGLQFDHGQFSFVSRLKRVHKTKEIGSDPRVVIFVRRNELIYVGAKVVNLVFLALLLVMMLSGETGEKTSYKKFK